MHLLLIVITHSYCYSWILYKRCENFNSTNLHLFGTMVYYSKGNDWLFYIQNPMWREEIRIEGCFFPPLLLSFLHSEFILLLSMQIFFLKFVSHKSDWWWKRFEYKLYEINTPKIQDIYFLGFTSLKTSQQERSFVLHKYSQLSDEEKKRFKSGITDSKAYRVGKFYPDYSILNESGSVIEVGWVYV